MIYINKNLEQIKVEIPATNPVSISGQWFWKLDIEFAAWTLRALRRAISADDAPDELCAAFDEIVAHCRTQGHDWPAIVARAATPVQLALTPDRDISLLTNHGLGWPEYAEHCHPSVIAPGRTLDADLGRTDIRPIPEPTRQKSTPAASRRRHTTTDRKGLFA